MWELIADSVENCWEMVSEYECKDVADESNDDKRSGRAEARGSQKRCRSQSQEKSQSFLRNLPTPDLTLYATLFVFVLVTMALFAHHFYVELAYRVARTPWCELVLGNDLY